MTNPGVHPDSGAPYCPVERAINPCVRVYDIALIEFEGPEQDMAEAFFRSFGLSCTKAGDGSLMFSAEAGAPVAVIYRRAAKARFIGPTFAVRSAGDLDQLAKNTGAKAPSSQPLPGNPPGVVLKDPNGLQVRVAFFDNWREVPACSAASPVNRGDCKTRINETRRPERSPSRVLRLGHMVLGTPKWEATARFYIDTLGLIPSDVQALPDGRPAVAFLRCDRGDEPADHHSFVVGRLPLVDFDHAAFEVPDLDDVGMGGQILREKGFQRAWGIGRHILGSQIFDYWYGPDHRKFEHFADGDMFDASRPTAYHPMSVKGLAQWAPPMPRDFLRPRLGFKGALQVIRGLLTGGDFGRHELRQLSAATRSKSLPE